jgi:REP element-mobilizing transposase RayT
MASAQRQLGFEFRTWGGVRKGAGRPPKGKTAGVSHLRWPSHSYAHPLHITLRIGRGISSLREHSLFPVVRRALADGKQHFGFSLVHFSVQRDHVHLIAEANDRRALSRGMQGLSIRLARAVNAQVGRKGKLFADRYHARTLKTPRTVRLALRYVLLNVRKHAGAPKGSARAPISRRTTPLVTPQESARDPISRRTTPLVTPQESARDPVSRRTTPLVTPQESARVDARPRSSLPASDSALPAGFLDACSSAPWFTGFSRPSELLFGAGSARHDWERASGSSEPPIVAPRCWLLRSGWKRAGPFDIDDTPGTERRAGVR